MLANPLFWCKAVMLLMDWVMHSVIPVLPKLLKIISRKDLDFYQQWHWTSGGQGKMAWHWISFHRSRLSHQKALFRCDGSFCCGWSRKVHSFPLYSCYLSNLCQMYIAPSDYKRPSNLFLRCMILSACTVNAIVIRNEWCISMQSCSTLPAGLNRGCKLNLRENIVVFQN